MPKQPSITVELSEWQKLHDRVIALENDVRYWQMKHYRKFNMLGTDDEDVTKPKDSKDD